MSHRKCWKRDCSLAPLLSLCLAEHCQHCRWKHHSFPFFWESVTQSPKCHLACGVFKSVHEGSYDPEWAGEGEQRVRDSEMKPSHSCEHALTLAGCGEFDRAFQKWNIWTLCEHLESSLFNVSQGEITYTLCLHMLAEHCNHVRQHSSAVYTGTPPVKMGRIKTVIGL